MSKDFFDEEYDKVTEQREKEAQQNQQAHGSVEDWYNYGGTTVAQKSSKKPLYVVLLCVGLVLTLVLGWVLCALFGGGGSLSGDEQRKYAQALVQNLRAQGIDISDEQMQQALQYGNELVENGQIRQEALLSAVLDYLHNKYVTDLDGNEQLWQDAIAAAGTALLQSAGDRFCSLMTPQQYYDYVNQVSETTASPYDTYFGVAYSYQSGLGLYVSTVSVDGSCYGIMQEGDVILAVTEPLDNLGNPVTADGAAVTEMVVADYSAEEVSALMAEAYSAKFRVLRNGDVFTTQRIVRGGIGLERPSYNYRFVEFYFNDSYKNISTTNQNNAVVNTYQLRQLSQLPQDTGYVRITEFMYYMDGQTTVTAATEFVQVMKLFRSLGLKRLVLDLKGNPGGLVSAVCDIAAMLVHPDNLTQQQKQQVSSGNRLLITELIPRSGNGQTEMRGYSYYDYFGKQTSLCDIVVWTDGGSASASELLTGALRDYGTAVQMGEKTYGKGIAQTVEELPYKGEVVQTNGQKTQYPWAIYYTFAAYYSPLGTNIHGTGYTPDAPYDGLESYAELWQATKSYWGV